MNPFSPSALIDASFNYNFYCQQFINLPTFHGIEIHYVFVIFVDLHNFGLNQLNVIKKSLIFVEAKLNVKLLEVAMSNEEKSRARVSISTLNDKPIFLTSDLILLIPRDQITYSLVTSIIEN